MAAQRQGLQRLGLAALGRRDAAVGHEAPGRDAAAEGRAGLPSPLREGMEALSGMDLSGVRVHRNSSLPAKLDALAYAQGHDIHLGPGQECHLPHEAWHVVQQLQGRVRPTMQRAGTVINDDPGLESEADTMGERAAQMKAGEARGRPGLTAEPAPSATVVQRNTTFEFKTRDLTYDDLFGNTHTQRVGEQAEAWIDPSNPVAGTTTPPSAGVFAHLNLIQGHLVNAHVGGPGRVENFFPISPSLNAQHKNNVELPLKYKTVELRDLQNGAPGWANRHLYYRVTATPHSWAAFDHTRADETTFDCEMAYCNVNHQRVTTLPRGTFTASDVANVLHTNLDQELTNLGAGAAGAPTATAVGGRHYTLGATANNPAGNPQRNLLYNGNVIGTVEDR